MPPLPEDSAPGPGCRGARSPAVLKSTPIRSPASGQATLATVSLRAAPWIAAAAGITIVGLCFYPGQMSADSIDQLRQARAGIFTDWHSPVMSWWWSCLDRVLPGPFGMLLFQNLLFWCGLAGILAGRLRPVTAGVLTLAIGLAPCCLGLLGTIWSDVGMGAALLLAVALIDRFGRTRSRVALAGAALLLFYACAIRKNAAAAALPVVWWAGLVWRSEGKIVTARRVRRSALPAILTVTLIFAGAQLVNRALAGPHAMLQSQQLFLHDLAAISVARKENFLPAYLRSGPTPVSLATLQKRYTSDSVDPLLFGDPPRVPLTTDRAHYAELRRQWWHQVVSQPAAYFRHRTAVMTATLGLTPEVVYPFHWGINPNEFGYAMNDTRWFRGVSRLLAAVKGTVFFRGWFFVLLGGTAVTIAWRRRAGLALTLALVGSGLTYIAPYYLISPAGDFRLIWWMVVAVLVALPISLGCPAACTASAGDGTTA